MTIANGRSDMPWQLKMFRKSLKKQLKVRELLTMLGDASRQHCLLITCGDNNGAINWYFREHKGNWTWCDVAVKNLQEIEDLLGETVYFFSPNNIELENDFYDCVVLIDVLEHLDEDQPILGELWRILKPGGRLIVTVPNGDPKLLANRIKWQLGMTPQIYGHTRAGYTVAELRSALRQAEFMDGKEGGYSRFFTEMIELVINYSYVYVLSRRGGSVTNGQIAPTTSDELKTHGAAYRLYSLAYPFMRLISKMDVFLPSSTNNAVIVEGIKPGNRVL